MSSGKRKGSVAPTSGSHLQLPFANGKEDDSKKKKEKQPQTLWTDEIKSLNNCDQFLIKQTNKLSTDITLPCTFDIRNGDGKLVFKAIESIDPIVRDLHHGPGKPPFIITIFDLKAGKEMLKINANLRQGVMLVYVKQYTEDKLIGIVRKVYSRCPLLNANFSLERSNGSVLLEVQSSSSLRTLCRCTCRYMKKQGRSFDIIQKSDATKIGKIDYQMTKLDVKEDDLEASRTKSMVKATFPTDLSNTTKSLVLAIALLLDSLYFQQSRRPWKKIKIPKTCYIVFIIVLLVAIIAVLAIVFGGRGFQGGQGGRRPGRGGFG